MSEDGTQLVSFAPGDRSGRYVALGGLVLLVAACIAELVTDRVSLTLFFVLPVFLVTWHFGRVRGLAFAALAAAAWLAADVASGDYPRQSLASYGNAASRLVLLTGISLLVAALRDSALKERALARQEHATAVRLRALNDLKDTLLHAVSHDLKGPMTAILGSAGMLRRADELGLPPDDRASLVAAIEGGGNRLLRLVTDLLDLDRIDRGVLEPDRRLVDVADLVERVVAEVSAELETEIDRDLTPLTISVDGAKVERIVDNLVRNAFKHTPLGTRVHVAVRREADGALLVVEDEGPGVPDGLKRVIFEPFAQGEAGDRAGGVGIGLSLVARFARLHGGRAWVEDRPGGGASFRVFLPEDLEARRAEEGARARHPSGSGARARSA